MYDHVKSTAIKIKSLITQIPAVTSIRLNLEEQKKFFLTDIKKEHVLFGILCILALIFDYGVTSKTLKPIARIWGTQPEILAILFNLIDAFIAIIASGILAKIPAMILTHKKTWRPILWALCVIKLALFFSFSFISGRNSIMGTILIVCLSIIVYIILDFAGGGLFAEFQ